MIRVFILLSLILTLVSSIPTTERTVTFAHHDIARPLPGKGVGTGGFTLNDYDDDGDLDITIQRSSNKSVYWYEFKNDSTWIRHKVGTLGGGQLGAVSADIDGDNFPDLVMGRAWFRNPGVLKQNPDASWRKNYYRGGILSENHDIEISDINLDGKSDVVCYSQKANILRWYDTSMPDHWIPHNISRDINKDNIHSGFSPNGITDLNGDNFPDIVMPFYWYENPGNSTDTVWARHSWPYVEVKKTPYGRSLRTWTADVDYDGDNDFIYTDSDVIDSKAYWVENTGKGKSWTVHNLPLPPGPTGSFHSLQVFDANLDGLDDIFIGEQEHESPMMKPAGLKERGMLLIREGSKSKPEYKLTVIHEDNPGWHDTQAGDVDGDGDIDLVTKIWYADEGEIYHADYWENKLKD